MTRIAALLSLAAFSLFEASAQSRPTRIQGRVVDVANKPIADAEIAVLAPGPTTTSDSAGRFTIDPGPGESIIRVRRIGYNADQFGATLREGETKEVQVVLQRGAYELPDVAVTARQLKPIEYAWTTRYDDFFRRRHSGFGHYLLREEIERKGAMRTPSILAGTPGVSLRFRHPGPSGTDVEVGNCPRVSVWIDGQKQRYPDFKEGEQADRMGRMVGKTRDVGAMITGSYLERVLPMQIELIEVYRSPAQMPAEFLDDSCAAIAIWLR